jgi:hypothetical protein
MSQPEPRQKIYWPAVALPAVTLLLVGLVYWDLANYFPPETTFISPFIIPALVGVLAGLLSFAIARVNFPGSTVNRGGQLLVSFLLTLLLAGTYCIWGNWVVQFAYRLGI